MREAEVLYEILLTRSLESLMQISRLKFAGIYGFKLIRGV
jgi:hypothetical protein